MFGSVFGDSSEVGFEHVVAVQERELTGGFDPDLREWRGGERRAASKVSKRVGVRNKKVESERGRYRRLERCNPRRDKDIFNQKNGRWKEWRAKFHLETEIKKNGKRAERLGPSCDTIKKVSQRGGDEPLGFLDEGNDYHDRHHISQPPPNPKTTLHSHCGSAPP